MSDPDLEIKSQIAENLEYMGFSVIPLDEREGQKTADLLATKLGQKVLIEVKSKGDDQEELSDQRKRLGSGEVVMRSEYWGPKNTVARIIKSGVRQLAAHHLGDHDFSLLWLHAEGVDADSQFQQFGFTLYGKTRVFSLRNRAFDHECYYFHDSAFYRWRNTLDGAIISTPKEAQLCINTYSPKADSFRQSEIVHAFSRGVLDPDVLERDGKIITADCEIDRREEGQIIGYLQRKYKQELLNSMHLGRIALLVEFPFEEEAAPNPGAAPDG